MKRQIVFALLTLLGSSIIHAQNGEVARIDAMVKPIDAMIKKQKNPDLVFADVSNYENNEPAKWRKFATVKALEKHRKTDESYSIAYVWRKGGKLAATSFTLSSPSGDWAKYVYSYYRPDGTLAKAAIDYRTFNGDLILEQDLYFDSAGKQIKEKRRVLDLTTHKAKKMTKDVTAQTAEMAKEKADYYKSTSKLPFANLIK